MICPECNGKGEVEYYREIHRDENSVTVEGFLDVCHTCHGSGVKITSNADHIRSMADEELAEWLADIDCNNCDCCVYQMDCRFEHDTETVNYAEKYCCFAGRVDWLKQPYGGDT